MAEKIVKLTIRLPARLHQALKERASEYNVSLNQAVVDALATELAPCLLEETEGEKARRVLREAGMLADASWIAELADKLSDGEELPTLEEVRDWLKGIPLSDWIIEDRGPR